MTDQEIIRMAKEAGMTGEMSDNVLEFLHNLLQAERERLASQIERMPFGDTASSFAVYVRKQASPEWAKAKAIKERYTEPRLCTTCKHMPKEGYCGKACIDKNKWEWAE